MEGCGAIDVTITRAAAFAASAKAALAPFPDNALRRALADVADYTLQRAR